MRTAFQIVFFIAYLLALAWGGWYVFSGHMAADQDAAGPAASSDVVAEDLTDDTADASAPTGP